MHKVRKMFGFIKGLKGEAGPDAAGGLGSGGIVNSSLGLNDVADDEVAVEDH